jgi:hypothetical protein
MRATPMSKRDNNAMKCRRCGQWIPLSAWKHTARQLIHDHCSAPASKALEAPRGTVMRRRGGVLRRIR